MGFSEKLDDDDLGNSTDFSDSPKYDGSNVSNAFFPKLVGIEVEPPYVKVGLLNLSPDDLVIGEAVVGDADGMGVSFRFLVVSVAFRVRIPVGSFDDSTGSDACLIDDSERVKLRFFSSRRSFRPGLLCSWLLWSDLESLF